MVDEENLPVWVGQATLNADLVTISGLHIGAGKDAIEIGGIDSPVVKTPERKPYVPGSSLKGKLRFLLEWAFGKVHRDGKPWTGPDEKDPILRIFGTAAKREAWDGGPTRLLMRDSMLEDGWVDQMKQCGQEMTEEKTEVTIDRVAGKALDKVGARRIERVPPGARFRFEASFRIYETGGDRGARDLECLAWLIQGLDLLEQDALGGSGSRGYGRVRFEELRIEFRGGESQSLDNRFRGHPFSRDEPPAEILSALKEAAAHITSGR